MKSSVASKYTLYSSTNLNQEKKYTIKKALQIFMAKNTIYPGTREGKIKS